MDVGNIIRAIGIFGLRALPLVMIIAMIIMLAVVARSCVYMFEVVITIENATNADLCISDVIKNDGIIRLPMPEFEISNRSQTWAYGKSPSDYISADFNIIFSTCERITGTKHSPEWDVLFNDPK